MTAMSKAAQDEAGMPSVLAGTREAAEWTVRRAKALGADAASAEASLDRGFVVGTRFGRLESVERTEEQTLSVSVWKGHAVGSASTSDLSEGALEAVVRAALSIASHVREDPFSGLPDAADLQGEVPDLRLHPGETAPSIEAAIDLLQRTEAAAFSLDPAISNTDGARFDFNEGAFTLANSLGFSAGYPYARCTIDCFPTAASSSGESQRDGWWSEARRVSQLMPPEALGRLAAERALRRLGARPLAAGVYDVLFEPQAAAGLLDILEALLSGRALYQRTSCLADAMGQLILPDHVWAMEDPYIAEGLGSGAFDEEGCAGHRRAVVEGGRLAGFFLSSYSARKLGLRTTGNAGGAYNLRLSSTKTAASDDFSAMLGKLHRGLLVTELIGSGFNPVTGDYSRGASGFWVENGRISHPVEGFSIVGNIRDMMMRLRAVGADELEVGARRTGSLLFEGLTAAGEE